MTQVIKNIKEFFKILFCDHIYMYERNHIVDLGYAKIDIGELMFCSKCGEIKKATRD